MLTSPSPLPTVFCIGTSGGVNPCVPGASLPLLPEPAQPLSAVAATATATAAIVVVLGDLCDHVCDHIWDHIWDHLMLTPLLVAFPGCRPGRRRSSSPGRSPRPRGCRASAPGQPRPTP